MCKENKNQIFLMVKVGFDKGEIVGFDARDKGIYVESNHPWKIRVPGSQDKILKQGSTIFQCKDYSRGYPEDTMCRVEIDEKNNWHVLEGFLWYYDSNGQLQKFNQR